MDELMLDGNAVAGMLSEVFAVEMTTATMTCGNFGTSGAVGAMHVFRGAGIVLRCPHCDHALVKIVVDEILYIEGVKDYIKIYLQSSARPVLTRMTLKAMEERLPPPAFIRTHKSFLVAVSKITTIKRDLVCIGNTEIPVSGSYKSNLNQILK